MAEATVATTYYYASDLTIGYASASTKAHTPKVTISDGIDVSVVGSVEVGSNADNSN